jgi:hypothetical protein
MGEFEAKPFHSYVWRKVGDEPFRLVSVTDLSRAHEPKLPRWRRVWLWVKVRLLRRHYWRKFEKGVVIVRSDQGGSVTQGAAYIENPRGHVWVKDEDGEVDILAFDVETETQGHNGPRCMVCGYGFCHHCQSAPDHDCPGPSHNTGSNT